MSIEANGHTNGEMEEVSAQEQAPSGASFDVVARGLANGTVSRRKALRLLAVGLVGSAVGFTPGVAAAKKCEPLGNKCVANTQCCSRYCDKRGQQCVCPPDTQIPCQGPTGQAKCVNICHPANDPCKVSLCDPTTGGCRVGNAPDGTVCEDGSRCTVGDTCQNGTCRPGTPVDCSALDTQCTEGFCDQQTGTCQSRNKPDNSSCNADDNACTENDTCQAGACVPGALKTCTASTDPCKVNVCDPATGDCVTQNAPNGTTCEDGNLCTTGETCQEGVCQGGTAVANCCQSTSDCPTPANQCLRATCISNVCGVENKPDNTACDDNLGCTRGETCLAGICQGGTSTCTGTNNFCCGAGTSRAGNCRQAPGTVCTQNNQCCNSCTGSRTTPGVCT